MRKVFVVLTFILLITGGLNWGLIGLFNWDMIGSIFGDMSILTRTIYIFIGLSGLYRLAMWFDAKRAVK